MNVSFLVTMPIMSIIFTVVGLALWKLGKLYWASICGVDSILTFLTFVYFLYKILNDGW